MPPFYYLPLSLFCVALTACGGDGGDNNSNAADPGPLVGTWYGPCLQHTYSTPVLYYQETLRIDADAIVTHEATYLSPACDSKPYDENTFTYFYELGGVVGTNTGVSAWELNLYNQAEHLFGLVRRSDLSGIDTLYFSTYFTQSVNRRDTALNFSDPFTPFR